jgi:hypothetical protein
MAKTKMARVIFVVLTACAAARAGPPPDTLSALREWDPRPSRVLDFKTAPTAGVMPSTQSAAPRIRAKYSPMDKFGEAYLKPRMMAVFPLENTLATADLRNPSSNPVARDPATLARVQKGATRAIKGALKTYAIEGIGINRWTIRLTNREGEQQQAKAASLDDTGGVRIRFGVSHLAPRADLLIPVDAGRVVVGADARGNVRTIFEPAASRLRVAADYDVPGHLATVRLGMRF